MKDAYNKYLLLKKGVVAQSEFWMMKKQSATMDKNDMVSNPTNDEVLIACKTIFRMRSSGEIFRSIDIINGLQTEMKGKNGDINTLKAIE